MELTLRWAERSKKYFEEHKHEVPWGSRQCPVSSSSVSTGSSHSGDWQTGNQKLGETRLSPSSASSKAAWIWS